MPGGSIVAPRDRVVQAWARSADVIEQGACDAAVRLERPGAHDGREGDHAAEEQVLTTVGRDERAERGEGASLTSERDELGGGSLGVAVSRPEIGAFAETFWCSGAIGREPVVEQAERHADAGGNRRLLATGRFGLHAFEDATSALVLAGSECIDGFTQRRRSEATAAPDRREPRQVHSLDRPVQGLLEAVWIPAIECVEIDTLVGKERGELLQDLGAEARLEVHLWLS